MLAPKHALLPCLIMAITPTAWAQPQQSPTHTGTSVSHPQVIHEADPSVTRLQVEGDFNYSSQSMHTTTSGVPQGWAGEMMTEAERLRRESIIVPGPAPSRTLRLGDSGQDAQWLIDALIAHGFLAEEHNLPTPQPQPGPYGEATSSWESGPHQDPTLDYESIPAVQQLDRSVVTEAVESALIAFQSAKGLKRDGVAGREVYSALTVDHGALANALESWASNIAAWSDQARAEGYEKMIVVNIPSYTLHAIDLSSNQEDIQSRVIVGRPYTRTPQMLTRVVNLKANPDWTPPKSIRGARYQRPGPNNALGLMRFSTDNNMSIYLHDTNARGLFANDNRALSHGCVRVQQWKPLAAWSAQQDEAWVDDVALAGGKTRFLKVDAIPVVISYSLVDMVEGQARVFDDVYNKGAGAIGHAALQGQPEPAARPWSQR